MESFVASLPNRRFHLPSRTYRSLLHLCSSFDREPRVSLATPDVLQELLLRTEIAQVSPGETCKPGEICPNEKPPENLSILESTSGIASGDSIAEKMLEDASDGNNLQDASGDILQKDFFDDFELMIENPEDSVNLFGALDVNDYDDDSMVMSFDGIPKQPLDLVQNVAEKPTIATELQVDSLEGDKRVSEIIGCKQDEVHKSVEVMSSGISENNNETLQREVESEKAISNLQVLTDSISQMVEDDDVEEGEISEDENVNMLIEDDLPIEKHEKSHVSQEGLDKIGEGTSKSSGLSLFRGVGSLSTPFDVKKSDQISNKEEKVDPGTSIKKRSAPSKEAKARKRAKSRIKRAKERIALGVKKLKLKTIAPKPKPIKYCRHYLKGRCHEGEKCKFSHDTTPETKSMPCCYFATQSCMKGDDCPYDHDLSKYPCNNFITKGVCRRGDTCLFSHKGIPQSANVTTSATNIAEASNKQTVREAIAKLHPIQAKVSSSAPFSKPSSQSSQRNSSDASSPKINEPSPFRNSSAAPKGMSFLSLDRNMKPSLSSDNQSLMKSQERSFVPMMPPKGISFVSYPSEEHKIQNQEPQEPASAASSRSLKTTVPNSHIKSSLNSAMKLAAEFESAKVERHGAGGLAEAVNKDNVSRNSGNISSKILDFLSSF